jgi:hypothetical protein
MPLSKITNPFLDPAGSARSNVYSPAANTIAITSAGVEKLRATSTGIGIGGLIPSAALDVNTNIYITETSANSSNTQLTMFSKFSDGQRGYVILKAESNSSGSSDLVVRSRNNFSEAEKFRIDSVGRVRIPNQPAALIRFAAGSYTGGTIRDATFSSLTAIDYNIGGHMNTSTGVFTCPVAGMYLCNTIWYNGTGNNGYIGVITAKNGSSYGMFWYNDDQGYGDDSVMDSRIVQASAGDTLRVQLYGVSNDSTPEIQFQVYYLG